MLGSLIAQGSDSPAVRHDLAFAQLCQGRAREAAEALAPVFSQAQPIPAECHLLQARILHRQGHLTEALEATERALASGGVDADTLGERALILLDLGLRDRALAAALECLSRYPAQVEAAIVSGTLALWSGRVAEAEDAFTIALRHNPKAGRARSGLAQVRMLSGELATARDLFVEAVREMPDHIGTWHALAWCQMLLGDPDAAGDSYQRAFALDRAFGETHGGMAIVHALLGRTLEAEQSIRRALRLDPQGRNALYAQSLLLMAQGHDTAAGQIIAPLLREAGAGGDDPVRLLKQLHAKLAAGRSVQA
jgi:tetratricopeptide (TPR) repeat protein